MGCGVDPSCNPSTWEAEAGEEDQEFHARPGLYNKTLSYKRLSLGIAEIFSLLMFLFLNKGKQFIFNLVISSWLQRLIPTPIITLSLCWPLCQTLLILNS